MINLAYQCTCLLVIIITGLVEHWLTLKNYLSSAGSTLTIHLLSMVDWIILERSRLLFFFIEVPMLLLLRS